MGLMKLSLFLFFIVVVVAPRSLAFLRSTKNWARAYGAPDNAFFGPGLTPRQMAEDNGRLLSRSGNDKKDYKKKYLSYNALRHNNIPCGHRGNVYYDCSKRQTVNPYRRGCTAITGCARFIN